jgi:hypothetical protein
MYNILGYEMDYSYVLKWLLNGFHYKVYRDLLDYIYDK